MAIPAYQTGTMTPRDLARFDTNGLIEDAGGLAGDIAGKGVNPFAITDSNATGLALNSGGTAGVYNVLGLGHDASGNGLLTLDSYGGLADKTFYFRKNGTLYEFPFSLSGIVGPVSSTVGHIATYNNTSGNLASDPGIPLVAGTLSGGFGAHAGGLIETNPGDFENTLYTANGGGILSGWWSANGSTYLGISARISGADDPPNYTGAITSHDAPRNALTVFLRNTGSLKDGVAVMGFGLGNAANTATWGGNLIAASSARFADTVKLVGLEIDVQFADTATALNPSGAGLYINLFNCLSGGPMIQGGAVGANTAWTNGIILADVLSPGTGLAFGSLLTQNPGSLINTVLPGGRAYTDAAISLSQPFNGSNGQLIKFTGSTFAHLTLMSMSTTDNFVIAYDSNTFFQQAGNNVMQLTVTTGLSLGVTSLSVWGRNNGGSALLPVTLGAVDSGGVGFRAMVVPN